jgi:hypothetical protein
MDIYELELNRIIAFPGRYYKYHFVYVETKPMPPTGLYEHDEDSVNRHIEALGYDSEEYALFRGNFFTREEYDDNGAERDGKYVNFNGKAELRYRYLTPHNFLIAPHSSPINNTRVDEELDCILNSIFRENQDPRVLKDFVQHLPLRPER